MLRDRVELLAGELGVASSDLESEHGRWTLYQQAVEDPNQFELLKRCLAEESDAAVASSVVLLILEKLTGPEHASWVEMLPADSQESATVRSEEVQVLVRARESRLDRAEVDSNLEHWTDWLQRRLVDVLEGESLRLLADRARTRKVRNVSAQRLRSQQSPRASN